MSINERRVGQQIRNFERALQGYRASEPLSRYLTRFYKENKQMGSSDRRMTSRFCYNYFRLGNAANNLSLIDRLKLAEYLCELSSDLLVCYEAELAATIALDISQKMEIARTRFAVDFNALFPFIDRLSPAVDRELFIQGCFVQPHLFIRIKRGAEDELRNALDHANIPYTVLSAQTLALPNGTNLQQLKALAGSYEVQDLSSQYTGTFFSALPAERWWDACAASGGKALMFLDRNPKTNLLVSDIRLSILRNLDERFEQAKIKQPYRKKVLDLSHPVSDILGNEKFDGIILDAPCSGSGTWGRTPEMMAHFSAEKLAEFSALQKKIASNVIAHLKPGKPLIYITCSVYSDENESVVEFIAQKYGLQIQHSELIKGYDKQADSMFVAVLIQQ
ncbi:RsmB/NOP family class I SAM-dependent RNA methyltransferase [Sphingobacterium sp. Mn56C]|uniref:RsmB/NOP family class I SAM-dependent RNA methyltransferase n=1 Tax=Sphingobacterium sp. Mn56C TaxID=3395261 RepID=UPI003BE73222